VAPFFLVVQHHLLMNAVLMVAGRDLTVCRPLGEALASAGLEQQRLVTRFEDPDALLARADLEGGVPIALSWDAGGEGINLLARLLLRDQYHGRPYVLVVPSDVVAGMAIEELERVAPDAVERVLVITLGDLGSGGTQQLLAMHVERARPSVLGLEPSKLRVAPAQVTDFPHAERSVANIERRAMQRGAFKVQALRTPRF
jgi:hypothetical protein